MISPFLHIEEKEIKGKGITICKVVKEFDLSQSRPIQEEKCFSKSQRKHLEDSLLIDYLVFRKSSIKPVGWLNLKAPLDEVGGSTLKYGFQEILSEKEKTEVFKTFLNYIQRFYGCGFDEENKNPHLNIFQEVRIIFSGQKKDFLLLLKAGFKISRVEDCTLILRHRYGDQTGISYEEVENLELSSKDFCSILSNHHFLKLEDAVLRREPIHGEDLDALKGYLKEKKDALSYYLFLVGDNFKLYLDYARVMTTIKGVFG